MITTIGNDILDSRDIQERIDELEVLKSDEELDEDDRAELEKLLGFKDEVDSDEWDFGITFIEDGFFEDYAQGFAEDIGAISRDMQWPLSFIDWTAATEALKMDYVEVKIDGYTYYYC